MRRIAPPPVFLALIAALAAQVAAAAPAAPAASPNADEVSIRTALADEAAAWNRGDIPAFMQAYEDAPDTTFISTTVHHGYQPILERYRRNYADRAQMGKLTFSEIAVRLLPGACGKIEFAIVTGRFHLDRATHGKAARNDGIFSLVWRKGPQGWKIILDHTS